MINTEGGERYQLNPDRSLIRLPDDAPIAVSPDGAHVAARIDSDTIWFQYIWHGNEYYSGPLNEDRPQILVKGNDVLFSKNSNLVAVWDDQQITVYMFHNRVSSSLTAGGVGLGMAIYQIAVMPLTAGEPLLVAWSDDSSTIAWQDRDQIWRWNLFDQAEAQLIHVVADEQRNRLMNVSRTGRFLRIGSPADFLLIDSRTGESYQNAVVSPNEQFLGFLRENRTYSITSWHDGFRQQEACKPPLRSACAENHLQFSDSPEIQVFPYELELLGLFGCDEERHCEILPSSWDPARGHGGNFVRYWRKRTDHLRQVAYDPLYRQAAVLRGEYQVELEFYYGDSFSGLWETDLNKLDFVNLEGIVDSPIASIEWGQPIFYDTFMLTATEYLPRTVTIAGGG